MEGEENGVNQSPENMESNSPVRREEELEEIGAWIEPNHGGNGEGEREGSGSAEASTEEGFDGGLGVAETTHEVVKRKRGRPKKYDSNGHVVSPMSPLGFSSSSLKVSSKRGRGRPKGSGKLQLLASLGGFIAETAGGNFTPHILEVQTGEDIVSTISSFSQAGPRAACVLSATGVVSSVTISQPNSSGGILRYEGRFEILSLSGSFTYGETSGVHRKNGMLTVSLAKPDGRVFGGGIAGPLLAAGPIQLIVASFKQNISKELKRRHSTESSTGNSDCATPTSVLLETNPGGGTNNVVTIRNENMNPNKSPDINGNGSELR